MLGSGIAILTDGEHAIEKPCTHCNRSGIIGKVFHRRLSTLIIIMRIKIQ